MRDEVMVVLPIGRVHASTKAELRDALGVEPVRASGYAGEWPDECCLCPCDLSATAKEANMQLHSQGNMGHTMTANVNYIGSAT